MAKYNGDILVDLDENEIMVFGSNWAGRHGLGAAKYARDHFGAVYGEGRGLQGRSYAFPTLDQNLNRLNVYELLDSVQDLYMTAKFRPGLTFILTKVGCGLAGYHEEFIKGLFKHYEYPAPDNIVFPEDWR